MPVSPINISLILAVCLYQDIFKISETAILQTAFNSDIDRQILIFYP